MVDFQNYYKAYLGIDEDNSDKIIPCKRRSEPFCFIYKQFLIMTKINGDNYYSVAPEFFLKFKNSFKPSLKTKSLNENLIEIDNTFCDIKERYGISKMYRFSKNDNLLTDTSISNKVEILNESNKKFYFKSIGNRGKKYKENQWQRRNQLIKDKRYFILIKNNEIAAYSFLSDIDNGGANIVVVTFPKYRKKGYGKAVVSKSVEWCYQNDLIPIYLVDQLNIASINLAKSLGFKLKTEEVIVSI